MNLHSAEGNVKVVHRNYQVRDSGLCTEHHSSHGQNRKRGEVIRNWVTKEATTSGIAARQAMCDKEGEETEGGGVRERLTQKEQIRDK